MPKRVNKSSSLFVRLKPAEHAKLFAAAESKGLGVSTFARMILIEYLDGRAKVANK